MIRLTYEDRKDICIALMDGIRVIDIARYYNVNQTAIYYLYNRICKLTQSSKTIAIKTKELKQSKNRKKNSYLSDEDIIQIIHRYLETN